MMNLYHQSSLESSKAITRIYSTSFSAAIRLLAPSIRGPIYAIYGFVRLADEIVDTFHGYDQAQLLHDLESEYQYAVKRGISTNPVMHAFQQVVNRFEMHDLVTAFLASMRMDLFKTDYHSREEYENYIYGSADVVGLMCLKVFTNNDKDLYQKLKSPAMKLGSAFQKVNFLRDLQHDFEGLGRSYFPNLKSNVLSEADKQEIVAEIHQDFAEALKGLKQLPREARFGVYLAYKYYMQLLRKIEKTEARKIAKTRIRVPDPVKFIIMFNSYMKYQLKLI